MISNKEKNFISVVIYVYNNEKEIYHVLENINEVLYKNFNKYEIICVNDASTDKSVKQIEQFANKLNNQVLNIVNMSYYQGVEQSMNAGVDLAIGDFVYEFDNIIQDYNKEVIMDVYYKCLQGFDIVSASPSSNRTKSSKIFYRIFNKYSNIQYKIHTENFRILSRRAINRVHSMNKKIPYRKAIYANCGLKVKNITYNPIETNKRNFNKQVQKNRRETASYSLILFTDIGYRFSIAMSIIMIITTILVAVYTVGIFLAGSPVQGWTTTMLFLSFAFLGLFIILTIVIKYLEIIIDLNFKKNQYNIESINKIN